jgi:riboflavin kinase/FMN adenylyltransferase
MKPTAVAIGVFDGVHLGHQHLLRRTIDTARELDLTPAVLTFHPHPVSVVAPGRAPRLLMTVEERCRLIREQGIENIVVLPFDARIAAMPPDQFADDILRAQLNARAILVGENFRFGCQRSGDVATLDQLGFVTRPLHRIEFRGHVVSSSEIRKRIEAGEVSRAGRLLNRCFALTGAIVHGHGIGSKQTVPTLNLRPDSEVIPARGVYITRTSDLGSTRRWNSITNVGTRPTFEDTAETSIETFLLDPFTEPTPARIRLEFLQRVRDEVKFESPEALKAQIFRDVSTARTYFRRVHW